MFMIDLTYVDTDRILNKAQFEVFSSKMSPLSHSVLMREQKAS